MFISPPLPAGLAKSLLEEEEPMPEMERLVNPVERYEEERFVWLALGGGLGADAGSEYREDDAELDCRLNMMALKVYMLDA